MKALSLWQPHASAIALGLKPYETRGWDTTYRGPLAIHASKKTFREKDYEWCWFQETRKRLSLAGMPLWRLPYGKIVCIVEVVDCVPTAKIRELARAAMEPGGTVTKPKLPPPDWYYWGDFSAYGEDGRPRFAFQLENVRKIPEQQQPVVVGRQGFFDVDNDIGLWG